MRSAFLPVVLGALAAAAIASPGGDPSATDAPADVSFEDFLGDGACAECHPRTYEVWRRSTHGRAGGRPDEVDLLPPFDGAPLAFRDAIVTPRRGARGQPVFEVRHEGGVVEVFEVAAVVGSGRLAGGGNQTFFAEFPDGTLRFLPFDWSARRGWFVEKRDDLTWAPITPDLPLAAAHNWPPHRVLGNDRHSSGCLDCHGSQIDLRRDPATGKQETRWRSLAIDCESCHGPGRRHVEIMRSPDARTRTDIGMTPLELLGKDASIQVCLRCHADKAFLVGDGLSRDDLEDHFALKLEILRNETFAPDGKVKRFGYQDNHLFSDCYVNGAMVCTDCHDPHSQTYRDIWGRPLADRFDDGQCTDCHASKAVDPARHTHHAAASPGSRCVACHMPYLQQQAVGTYVPYERADHTVSIPRPALDASFGITGACLRCHADLAVTALQDATDRWWAPAKPRPWYVDAILRARDEQDLRVAAELLLRPDVDHPSSQILALSTLLTERLEPDMVAVHADVVRRLEELAASTDLDLTGIALASLHLVRGSDPAVRGFFAERLGELGRHAIGVRVRWGLALDYLGRRYESRGEIAKARAVRAKLADLAAGTAF